MDPYFTHKFVSFGDREAIQFRDRVVTYNNLHQTVKQYLMLLKSQKIEPGAVVSLEGNFSPSVVALFVALMENRNIIVPVSPAAFQRNEELLEEAFVTCRIRATQNDHVEVAPTGTHGTTELIGKLQKDNAPGLVLFSSGSTGKSKAIIHNLEQLSKRYIDTTKKSSRRILIFLLFDHIGGINTLLYTLATGSCLIIPEKNEPDEICRSIQTYRANLLPTTPSFLNLLLLSGAYDNYDLSSLKFISYGTEPMPDTTVMRLKEKFPKIRFIQTYGLSEVGILTPRANPNDAQWFKLDPSEAEHKIVEGQLWLRTRTNMLGYLNAESRITEDGWFNTEDAVEEKDGYIRILGRTSELINVGGQKVLPQEIENVIMKMDGIEDVLVYGEPHPIVGQIVAVHIALKPTDSVSSPPEVRAQIRTHCSNHLERFKIPAKIEIVEEPLVSSRFKKQRTHT